MMPRPQFTLRALLVAMLVVAAFLGGMAVQRERDKSRVVKDRSKWGVGSMLNPHWTETVTLQDGTQFSREWDGPPR